MSHSCDDEYDVYKETPRRARKEHRCHACGAGIRPGHKYMVVATVYDGSATTIKRCGRCQRTHEHLRELCRSLDYELWPDERLNCGLDYEDEWCEPPPAEIAALPMLTDDEASALLEDHQP